MTVSERTAKINLGVAGFVALLGAAAWFHPAVAGSDLWWHLASGRDLLAQGSVPRTDPYSYTFGGREWINHEWLWDVIYWSAYRLHPQAVAWLNLGVVTAVFVLCGGVALRASRSLLGAGAALWLVAASAHWFLDIRPHLWTLLFVGIFLLTRDRRAAPWLWPPLVALWTNLHGGFVFGIGAIGLHVLVKTARASHEAGRLVIPAREWAATALCLVAWLANPWGYRILEYPLAYTDADSPFRGLVEWRSPGWGLDLRGFEARFWLFALLALPGVPILARRDPYLVALPLVTFAMAWTSRRFIPLFGVTAAPLVACAIGAGAGALRAAYPALRHPAAGPSATVVAGLAALWLWSEVRLLPDLLGRWTESAEYPDAALRYMRAIDAPVRLLNHYNWGGYIMLHAPRFRLFIDGRANTLYDDEIYLDYVSFLRAEQGMGARVAKYAPEVALLPAQSPLAAALEQRVYWRRIYGDTTASVLVPPDSPLLRRPLPAPAEVLGDHPEQLMSQALEARARGDLAGAELLAWQAAEARPLMDRAWGLIIQLESERGDRRGVETTVARAIEANPRRDFRIHLYESRAYRQLGDGEASLRALRRAVPWGPFGQPDAVVSEIRSLERHLRERRAS